MIELTHNKYEYMGRVDGYQEWYIKEFAPNKHFYHREDGPARKWYDGTEEWYIQGKHHRLDGPAVIAYHDGREIYNPPLTRWWIHGENVTIEVNKWLMENNISWPFDKETQVEFLLRFG